MSSPPAELARMAVGIASGRFTEIRELFSPAVAVIRLPISCEDGALVAS